MSESRAVRVVVGIVGVIVAVNAAVYLVDRLAGGPDPTGPVSSSYTTAPEGLAAYADLLVAEGHPVSRIRSRVSEADLETRSTVVLLDAPGLTGTDTAHLRGFVEAGGRLVAGGTGAGWLREVVGPGPAWRADGSTSWAPVVPVPEVSGVGEVRSIGDGAWTQTGAALPVLADAEEMLAAVAVVGAGRVVLLADASPLQNHLLDEADNAAFGLAVAGGPGRPVAFVESVHGFGEGEGFAAIPLRWRITVLGLLLAVLVWMWAVGRRLGPPEEDGRDLPPARREYVDAMAATLVRSRNPEEALRRVRSVVRDRIARRAGLGPDASDDELRAAARRIDLGETETAAVFGGHGTEEVLALGRALAGLAPPGEGREAR